MQVGTVHVAESVGPLMRATSFSCGFVFGRWSAYGNYGAEPFTRGCQFCRYSRTSQIESSLLCSQGPSTCLPPVPQEPSRHLHTVFKVHFNIIFRCLLTCLTPACRPNRVPRCAVSSAPKRSDLNSPCKTRTIFSNASFG
jgi:hypothetical protein